jgi:hypothetical protein
VVVYRAGGKDVTSAVTAGTYRTGPLGPNGSFDLVVTVTRTKAARAGDERTVQVQVRSVHTPDTEDTVSAAVRLAG